MESLISLPSITGEKPKKRIIGPPGRETGGTSDPNATNWIIQINESLESVSSDEQQFWKKSIYKVPAYVADPKKEAYRPQVVSFGPYHHGNDHLRPMEDHKRRALRQFLRRSRRPLQPFLESVRAVAGDLKASYDALDPKWKEGSGDGTADCFLELMITDGCFMLEILRYAAGMAKGEYGDSDPIFSKRGELYVLPFIRRDMLLLENQLPMLLLDRLVAIHDGVQEDEFINRLILNFCSDSVDNVSNEKCLHVLDVLKKNMLTEPKKKDEEESQGSKQIIPSATELREHGISLQKSDTNSPKNISFHGGVLRLPRIVVDGDTETMFLNLMAFERFHVRAGIEVTSYIFFMDNIIYNEQDVALLHDRGIILNATESDEVVAKLFHSLAKDVVLDRDSSLHDVIIKLGKYCKKRWNRWRASLIQNYFRNPWAKFNLIAAVILFFLTLIQTVYTVLSYHK